MALIPVPSHEMPDELFIAIADSPEETLHFPVGVNHGKNILLSTYLIHAIVFIRTSKFLWRLGKREKASKLTTMFLKYGHIRASTFF